MAAVEITARSVIKEPKIEHVLQAIEMSLKATSATNIFAVWEKIWKLTWHFQTKPALIICWSFDRHYGAIQ